MKVLIDIECNGLENPDKIWLIVCKDVSSGELNIFRNVTNETEKQRFLEFSKSIECYIGHNILGYDIPILINLLGLGIDPKFSICCDTLIVSKLVDYSREQGHSIEAYGLEFDIPKGNNNNIEFFKSWSQELEDYCIRDVEIVEKIYNKYLDTINDPKWKKALDTEHLFQYKVINKLRSNGFSLDQTKANNLLEKVTKELSVLDKEIADAFPPRLHFVKEITPRLTKYGTINRSDFRWYKGGDLSEFSGGPFCRCEWRSFNPASHRQIIQVLHSAGWKPTDKTASHIETERENWIKFDPLLEEKLKHLSKFGWKVNENNLSTLPATAPAPARLLAKRILYESRRRTLTEWLGLVKDDGRIHGQFQGIGAWTHRMAHQKPNMANIPNEYKEDGTKKLLGKELRSCWRAPKNRLLVGVDAEGIQLRIFAHYVNDPELTKALVDGRKSDKTDPHSLNQKVLGSICKSRQAAKRFLYSLLLGGGVGKFSEILACTKEEAQEAVNIFNKRYPGFAELKRRQFPSDAKRGFFIGLDGRRVPIPGTTQRDREHLCMSGYLQNGEAIIMKMATLKFIDVLDGYNSLLVDLVHDEWQTETPNNMATALQIAKLQADSLQEVGEELRLNCPMAGSYWNEDHKDYTIGTNWYQTH